MNKPRNVTLDHDLQVAVSDLQDRLESRLGFRPSLPQALRHAIAVAKQQLDET